MAQTKLADLKDETILDWMQDLDEREDDKSQDLLKELEEEMVKRNEERMFYGRWKP